MSLLSPADQARLREDLATITNPVRLVFFTQAIGCETCEATRQILDEIPALTDNVSIEEVNIVLDAEKAAHYGIDRAPAIAVLGRDASGAEHDSRIRFLGMPAGYEFASLLRAVMLVGGGPSLLSDESRARLAGVDRPIAMHVFTTPTCPHCPAAVSLAHEMAWASPHITAYAVEATEFPDLARQYRVTGVPKTVVEGGVEILGALPESAFVEQALAAFTVPAAGEGSLS